MRANKLLVSLLSVVLILGLANSTRLYAWDVHFDGSMSATTETDWKSIASEAGATEGSLNIPVRVKGKAQDLILIKPGEGVSIDETTWSAAKHSDVTKVMHRFVNALGNSGIDPDAVHQFMGMLQDSDTSVATVMLPLIFEGTKGDMYQAYKITSPFLEILSVVLGVGAVLLILLLLFSTVMDLAYIGLPVWRESNANREGGSKQPFGVSYEALTTVTSIEKDLGSGDYKNAYVLYFQRRVLTYIILAICIVYLIGGGLSGIIGFILSLVGGMTG